MPTYEYICTSCAHEWEFEQSIREDPLKECPKCNNQTARRQISRGTGFILKGGGWYSDLYSSPSNKKEEGAAKSEGTKKDDNGTSSEAKSASTDSSKSTSTDSSSSTSSSSSTPSTPSTASST